MDKVVIDGQVLFQMVVEVGGELSSMIPSHMRPYPSKVV